MMYVMKQKFFALGGDYSIKDQSENEVYFVDGKVFSLGKKFDIKDPSKNVVARIQQKLFSFGTTYNIYKGEELAATVTKSWFTFFKTKFKIDVPGPDDIDVSGNFLAHEYEFTRGGKVIAKVSKSFFSWTDTYGIDVQEGEDDLLILCAAVIIDTVCHERKN